ncbi:hypothetical protein TWF730_007739 [Orbilia blumenaviensis]|uniref:Bola-like protein n=1 Tax=Orbilia blumenaviensis TaxID=1796055 RepID=A0AAV9V9F5_9PEZI
MSILRSFGTAATTAATRRVGGYANARLRLVLLPTITTAGSQRWFSRGLGLRYPVEGVPEYLDEKEAGIFEKLRDGLSPSRLDVKDISGGCGSMYAVEIESPKFRGLTTLKMHREVQGILAEEIKGWHGIQLKTKATPVGEE